MTQIGIQAQRLRTKLTAEILEAFVRKVGRSVYTQVRYIMILESNL